jgi:hypothetical protein
VSAYKNRLKEARRPERAVPICLRGDLLADWQAAEEELKRAQGGRGDSLEDGGIAELAERVRALEAEMLEHSDQFRLRAMPRYKFRALVAAHPPRTGDDGTNREDAQLGVNRDTFFPDLIRASIVEPVLDDEDWKTLLGDPDDPDDEGLLTDRQFGDLEDAAWFLNRGEVDIPFSRAASLIPPTTAGE